MKQKNPDRLSLYHLNNGILAKSSDGLFVFESVSPDDKGYDAANIKEVLWHVHSWLSSGRDNRYSAERVRIIIEPGDKAADASETKTETEAKTEKRVFYFNEYRSSSGGRYFGTTFVTLEDAQNCIDYTSDSFIKTVRLVEEDV